MPPRRSLNSLSASCPPPGYSPAVRHLTFRVLCTVRLNVLPTLSLGSPLNATRYDVHPITLIPQMKHVANPKRQYCANVVLKLNAKLGGANVYLPPRHMPFVSERPTVSPTNTRDNSRLSWALMLITPLLETPSVHLSVPSLPAWTLALVVTLLPCEHKVLELKSFPTSKP